MKNKHLIMLAVLILVVGSLISIYTLQNQSPIIRQCPNEWIEDRMPGVEGDDSERQYFIFNGERKEIKNYDVNWIKNNCSVQARYVY